jgi:uncharacterized damage-inducible protein DinB
MTAAAPSTRTARPDSSEYFSYYERYIALVPNGDIVRQLESQHEATRALLAPLSPDQAGHRYASGKWTVREVVGHLADAERVFVYRAMRFARADSTPLPGFDENAFAANASYDQRTLESVLNEFTAVRRATIAFCDGLTGDEWTRRGVANDKEMSVRALAWTIAGHELHHREIVRTRYLGGS